MSLLMLARAITNEIKFFEQCTQFYGDMRNSDIFKIKGVMREKQYSFPGFQQRFYPLRIMSQDNIGNKNYKKIR